MDIGSGDILVCSPSVHPSLLQYPEFPLQISDFVNQKRSRHSEMCHSCVCKLELTQSG